MYHIIDPLYVWRVKTAKNVRQILVRYCRVINEVLITTCYI